MTQQQNARARLALEHLQLAAAQLNAINWRTLMEGEDDLRIRAIEAIKGVESMVEGMSKIGR